MTGIVPNDLAHSPITKYKDEPIEHPVSLFALFFLRFLFHLSFYPSICSASSKINPGLFHTVVGTRSDSPGIVQSSLVLWDVCGSR